MPSCIATPRLNLRAEIEASHSMLVFALLGPTATLLLTKVAVAFECPALVSGVSHLSSMPLLRSHFPLRISVWLGRCYRPFAASTMDSTWDVDASEGLTLLLTHVQVPEPLQTALQQTGLLSISDFAYAYTSPEDLASFVARQSQDLWDQMQITDPEHSPAVARLRRALDLSKSITKSKDASPAASSPTAPHSIASNVWAEHAPPRLDSEAVQRMQSTFKANYPGEHLDSDCMPSIRLLSIVHLWFAPRGTIKWVPWQLRMSQRQYQEIMEARTTKTLRAEAQLVSSALFDETPELSIDRAHLSPAWLARTQQVFRNAIALCGGAHLAVLKAFDKKKSA